MHNRVEQAISCIKSHTFEMTDGMGMYEDIQLIEEYVNFLEGLLMSTYKLEDIYKIFDKENK